jgi:hypothetical protein
VLERVLIQFSDGGAGMREYDRPLDGRRRDR